MLIGFHLCAYGLLGIFLFVLIYKTFSYPSDSRFEFLLIVTLLAFHPFLSMSTLFSHISIISPSFFIYPFLIFLLLCFFWQFCSGKISFILAFFYIHAPFRLLTVPFPASGLFVSGLPGPRVRFIPFYNVRPYITEKRVRHNAQRFIELPIHHRRLSISPSYHLGIQRPVPGANAKSIGEVAASWISIQSVLRWTPGS